VWVFADELDIHLVPKVGAAWMPKGSQEEVMTLLDHTYPASRVSRIYVDEPEVTTAVERMKANLQDQMAA
jgi:hypothetical protein